MPTRPQFTVAQLEGMVRTDPEKVVLHAFRTVEICLRELMKLGDAQISGIFHRAHREGLIGDLLYHQLRTLKRLRNDAIHDRHRRVSRIARYPLVLSTISTKSSRSATRPRGKSRLKSRQAPRSRSRVFRLQNFPFPPSALHMVLEGDTSGVSSRR